MSRRLLPILVVLIALHSITVGCFLMFATVWGTAFGGWTDVHPLFFPRQAGVFHFVVAAGYLIEYFKYRGITLMLAAKAIAVCFLLDATWRDGGPWAVPLSAAADAAMGVTIWVVYRAANAVARPGEASLPRN